MPMRIRKSQIIALPRINIIYKSIYLDKLKI